MDPLTILMLAALNFFLCFYSVIVGGGSLVMIPLMISLGVPVHNSIAISRFYNIGTGGASLFKFNEGGKVNWKIGLPLGAVAAVASIAAANMVLSINESVLKGLIAVIIIFFLIIMVFNKGIGTGKGKGTTTYKKMLGYILTFAALFVTTFTGGGGTIMSYILIFLFGQTFLQSMGTRKIVTLSALIFSSIFFAITGTIIYEIAVPLMVTGALGGYLGAKYAMKKGDKWARIFFIIVVFLMTVNMLINV